MTDAKVRARAPDQKADATDKEGRPLPQITADKMHPMLGVKYVSRLVPLKLPMDQRQDPTVIQAYMMEHKWHYSARNVDAARAAMVNARNARVLRQQARDAQREKEEREAAESKQVPEDTQSDVIADLREKQLAAAQIAASAAQISRDVTHAAAAAVISEKTRLEENGASEKEVKEGIAVIKSIARDATRTSEALDTLARANGGEEESDSSLGESSGDDVPIAEFVQREKDEEEKHASPKKASKGKKPAKKAAKKPAKKTKKEPPARNRRIPQVTEAKAASMKLLGDKSLRRLAELAMNRESPKMTKQFIAQFNVRLHEWLVAGLHNTSFSIHNCKGKTITVDAIETGFDVLGFDNSTDDNVPVPEDRVEDLIGDSKGFLPVAKAIRDALLYYGGVRFTRVEPGAVKYVQNLMLLQAHRMLAEVDKILTREAIKNGGKGGVVLRVCPTFVTMQAGTGTMGYDDDEEDEAETPDAVTIVIGEDEGDDEDVFDDDVSSCEEDDGILSDSEDD